MLAEEQEQKLSELGYVVRYTFLEEVVPPATLGEAVRRANSDPTPSSSCSSRSASADSQRQGDPLTSSGSAKEASSRPKDASKQAAAQAPTEGGGVFDWASDLREVRAQVPLDQDGRLTSLGSEQHSSGALCRFCHFPHATKQRIRLRPCKIKRERMKRRAAKASAAAESAQQDGLEYDVSDAKNMPERMQQKPLLMQHEQSVVADGIAKSNGPPLDSQEHLDHSVEMYTASPRANGGSSPAASSSSMPHALTTMPPGLYRAAQTDGLAGANITRFSL